MKGDTSEQRCVTCHSEHYGRDFSIITWPTSKDEFDHRETGWPLNGRHARLECDQCHQAKHIPAAERAHIKVKDFNRTLLGLDPQCTTCHQDRHVGQLGPDCARCHGQTTWKPAAGFNHEMAKFHLAGRHEGLACEKCHKPVEPGSKTVKYTRLAFKDCAPCHADPHGGSFKQSCENCHAVAGWRRDLRLTSFEHEKTAFPLNGKHAGLACQKCHKTADFHTPVAHTRCLDCHQEIHGPQFRARADGGDCKACHAEKSFKPATFTLAAHQKSAYPLDGKHAQVECAKCHPPAGAATAYHPAHGMCLDCHKDAHDTQFAGGKWQNRCDACHAIEGFKPSTYTLAEHRATRFPLPGAHAAVPCAGCHRPAPDSTSTAGRYHFASLACTQCHVDPHRAQTAADTESLNCTSCHTENNWHATIQFDHSHTSFPLDGAHRSLGCLSCHKPTGQLSGSRRIVFSMPGAVCGACHEDIHGGQFQQRAGGNCAACHTTTHWKSTLFNHEKDARFALTGVHREVPCVQCHKHKVEMAAMMVLVYKETPGRCAECHK